MPEKSPKEEILHLIRELDNSPAISQRSLSTKLGISLGKTNYLLRELIKKGLIKVKGFSDSNGKSKLKKIRYNLTQKGIEQKLKLTYHFLKRKEEEYNRIRKEWELMANLSGEPDKEDELAKI